MAKKKPKKITCKSILAECKVQVLKGLGRKRASRAATSYWKALYTTTITKQMAKSPGTWSTDRKRVLPVARKLGKVAAALQTGNIVLKWAAEAAAIAVKVDPGCPNPGAGGYCDF